MGKGDNQARKNREDLTIKTEQVSKKFCKSLQGAMLYGLADISRNILGMKTSSYRLRKNEFWAVDGVSFEIQKGETIGIIGRNGSGKSTLLKMLNGIFWPDRGRIDINGKVGALIEVGAGFHPMLTGRENIYLYSAILGMSRKEISQKFDAILDFAEIGDFIDTPMKFYSSGMHVRLGFATACHCEPDILLVDEVLAVGDLAFQSKSIRRMREFVSQGKTVVFVSHSMSSVQSLCSRVIYLDKGRVIRDGRPDEVIRTYVEDMESRADADSLKAQRAADTGTGEIYIKHVALRDRWGNETSEFSPGDSLTVEIYYHAAKRITRPYFWLGIYNQYGPVFGASMMLDNLRPEYIEGDGKLSCHFPGLPLKPQVFNIIGGIRGEDGIAFLIETRQLATLRVVGSARDLGFQGEIAESLVHEGSSVVVPYEWHLPDGKVYAMSFDKILKEQVTK